MKMKIGVAALLGVLAASALAASAYAQCGNGLLIKFDADCFAYESNAPQVNVAGPGSQLNVVGIVSLFCAPFQDLNATDPGTEYTFLWTDLTTPLGTQVTSGAITINYNTDYTGGSFAIYAGSPRNAPTAAGGMPINPPNAAVPPNFTDGTLILQGTLANFHTLVTKFISSGVTSGSFRSDYLFTGPTGGTYLSRVSGAGSGLLQGAWCVQPTCSIPSGYESHPNGKWDLPSTATAPSTWGAIKQLYR